MAFTKPYLITTKLINQPQLKPKQLNLSANF